MAQTLWDRAAQVIRERGWTQHGFVDGNGSVCLVGALALAQGLSEQQLLAWHQGVTPAPDAIEGYGELREHLHESPVTWNDSRARTQEQVLEVLGQLDQRTRRQEASRV